MVYCDAAYVARADGCAAPVLVGGVVDAAFADCQAVAEVCRNGGRVGYVRLEASLAERTGHYGRAADVLKRAGGYLRGADCVAEVQRRRPNVAEAALGEGDARGELRRDGGLGARYPRLVLKLRLVWQSGFFQLVGVDEAEAALQGDVPLVRRARPRGVLERYVVKPDAANLPLARAADFYELLQGGHGSL